MADPTLSIYMCHMTQTTPGGAWSNPGGFGPLQTRLQDLDINQAESVAITNTDGHIDVFFNIQIDNGPYLTNVFWQTQPSTENWNYSISPLAGTNLAVAQNADGRIELFGIGAGNNILHAFQATPSRGPWTSRPFGGQAKKLTVIRGHNGCLNLFYIGTDNTLWRNFQTAPNADTWGFNKFPYTGKLIASGMNIDGRIEVVFTGMDDRIYSISEFAPGSSQWHYGLCAGSAQGFSQVVTQADGRLCLAFIGIDDGIYFISQSKPSAGPWTITTLGGGARALHFVPTPAGALALLYIGIDYNLYQQTQTSPNGGWNHDSKINNVHALSISSALNSNGHAELLYLNAWEVIPNDPGGDSGGGTLDPVPGGGDVDQPDPN